MRYVLAALLGVGAGALGGFVTAVLFLTAKRLRNARLAARDEPLPRDLLLSPLHAPGALVGALAAPVASRWLSLARAGLVAGLAPLALFAAVYLCAALYASAFASESK